MKICYGIEIQGDKAVVVRAEMGRGGVITSTVPAGTVEEGAYCVGCLSVRESFTRWLEVPFRSTSKARKVLPSLLDIQLPFALEECHAEYFLARRTDSGLRALAIAGRITDIEERLKTYKGLGFDVPSLDQEGVALWTQSLKELPLRGDDADVPRIVVYLGRDKSSLVIGLGGEFISAHGIRSGDASQVRRLLEAVLKGVKKNSVRWIAVGPSAGDGKQISQLMEQVGEEWRGSVETLKDTETFLARALAMRALEAGELRCNLRGGSLMHPLTTSIQRAQVIKPLVVVLLAGLMLILANIGARLVMVGKNKDADKATAGLASQLAGYHISAKGKDAVAIVERKVNERAEKMQPFLDAFDSSLTEVISSIMKIGTENGLRFELISLENVPSKGVPGSAKPRQSNGVFSIRGTAREWTGCDKLMEFLKGHGYSVVLERKDALSDERIPFVIKEGTGK